MFAGYLGRDDLTMTSTYRRLMVNYFIEQVILFKSITMDFFIFEEEKIIKSNYMDKELNLEKLSNAYLILHPFLPVLSSNGVMIT